MPVCAWPDPNEKAILKEDLKSAERDLGPLSKDTRDLGTLSVRDAGFEIAKERRRTTRGLRLKRLSVGPKILTVESKKPPVTVEQQTLDAVDVAVIKRRKKSYLDFRRS